MRVIVKNIQAREVEDEWLLGRASTNIYSLPSTLMSSCLTERLTVGMGVHVSEHLCRGKQIYSQSMVMYMREQEQSASVRNARETMYFE